MIIDKLASFVKISLAARPTSRTAKQGGKILLQIFFQIKKNGE
jgi:hypothetical protein